MEGERGGVGKSFRDEKARPLFAPLGPTSLGVGPPGPAGGGCGGRARPVERESEERRVRETPRPRHLPCTLQPSLRLLFTLAFDVSGLQISSFRIDCLQA